MSSTRSSDFGRNLAWRCDGADSILFPSAPAHGARRAGRTAPRHVPHCAVWRPPQRLCQPATRQGFRAGGREPRARVRGSRATCKRPPEMPTKRGVFSGFIVADAFKRAGGTGTPRQRLPNRRASENLTFELEGLGFTATVSRFDDGRIAGLFLNNHKSGNQTDTNARDAAILLSFALQYGADVEAIRTALCRDGKGQPLGPIGAALDLIAGRRP